MVYNFCRPHGTLTRAAKGIHTTPTMAAGVADHVWTAQELVGLLDPQKLLQMKLGPTVGASGCSLEHVGVALQGRATAASGHGRAFELAPGSLFPIPPAPPTAGSSATSPRSPCTFSAPPSARAADRPFPPAATPALGPQ